MNSTLKSAIFEVTPNPLWIAAHFPKQYLHQEGKALFTKKNLPSHLLCCCDQKKYALGLFYEDWDLVFNFKKATIVFFEQLKPAKGAGSLYISIKYQSENQTPFPILSGNYSENNLQLFEAIAQTLVRFTNLPLEKVDLGFDV